MEFNYRNNYVRLGIANSIAFADDFDWLTTIHYAKNLSVSLIQFYISQKELSSRFQNIKSKWNFDTDAVFHLPVAADPEQVNESLTLISRLATKPVTIFHEKDMDNYPLDQINQITGTGAFAIENDTSDPLNLNSYLIKYKSLDNIIKSNSQSIAVLDIARYFMQYASNFSSQEIINAIKVQLLYFKKNNIPIIFHLIDMKSFSSNRAEWTALFQGCIPWDEILRYALSIPCLIKAFILEYEDFALTRDSIQNLKDWWDIRNNLRLR